MHLNDLQDKTSWCSLGERLEIKFLEKFGNDFGLVLNPEKISNPLAPDFIHKDSNRYVDLKTQNTPFFSSGKYNLDPQYAVTFNLIDKQRYLSSYPGIIVLFHVEWLATKIVFSSGQEIFVKPMKGIWATTIEMLSKNCKSENLHFYTQRKNDNQGNARSSYILDLRANYMAKKWPKDEIFT